MEVHHHPHVEKKNVKEYFLEFLMIFLAVSLGFLAENLRENISDKEKEKEYISSLIKNLQEDTAHLRNTIADNKWKIKKLDTLVSLSHKNIMEPANRKKLYDARGYTSYYSSFISNDATMMQLKNSGGLRFIRHNHVADSIAKFDLEIRSMYLSEPPYSKSIDDAMEYMQEIIVFTIFDDSSYYKNGMYTNKELPLLTTDSGKIKTFFNKIYLERGWTKNYVTNLEGRLPYAIRLIAFLKKEYDIE